MNYIQAHKILTDYRNAIANATNNSLTFIAYSTVNASSQEVYDAYVIFLGHMVLYNTLTNEQYQLYISLLPFVPNIIPDTLYNQIVNDNKLVYDTDKLFHLLNKRKIGEAKKRIAAYMDLLFERNHRHHERIKEFDYGQFVTEMQKLKQEFLDSDGSYSNAFYRKYVDIVYKYTSMKAYTEEDFCLFSPFKYMLNRLSDCDDSFERDTFLKYKNYILSHVD